MGEGLVAAVRSRCLAAILICLGLAACSLDTAPRADENGTRGDHSGDDGASGIGGAAGAQFPPGSTGGTGGISTLPGADSGTHGPGVDAGEGTADAAPSTSDAALDGSTVHAVAAPGAPCTTDAECSSPGVNRTCVAENALAPLLVLPGGYCSQFCDSGLACEPGATCVVIPIGFSALFVCMEACTTDTDCRVAEGYTCNMALSDTPVCSLPN